MKTKEEVIKGIVELDQQELIETFGGALQYYWMVKDGKFVKVLVVPSN